MIFNEKHRTVLLFSTPPFSRPEKEIEIMIYDTFEVWFIYVISTPICSTTIWLFSH